MSLVLHPPEQGGAEHPEQQVRRGAGRPHGESITAGNQTTAWGLLIC